MIKGEKDKKKKRKSREKQKKRKKKGKKGTYIPPFTAFTPKLPPTFPVHRHVWPRALVHVAIAVLLTSRHVMAAKTKMGEVRRKRRRKGRLRWSIFEGGGAMRVIGYVLCLREFD